VDAQPDYSSQQYPYPSNQEHPSLDTQHPFHKRPRLTQGIQMPAPYADGAPEQGGQEEKTPLGRQPDGGTNGVRRSYGLLPGRSLPSGWTGARLADCFASISMCPPFESEPGMFSASAVLPVTS
jgi:hypothetical protein